MAEINQDIQKGAWKNFLKKHWKMTFIIAAGIACAFIGAIFVFLWRTTGPEALARYPPTLGLWTVGYLVSLLVDLILWGLLLIVAPIIAAAIGIYFLWWKKLLAEERQLYARAQKIKNRERMSGGVAPAECSISW